MNFAPAPLQYVRDIWQGILNEIKRVDGQENAKRDRANTFRGDQTVKGNLTATNLSGANSGDVTLAGETYLTLAGQQITAAKITEAQQNTSDVTTANVSSAKHGYAPKSSADATQFLNGAAAPAFAQVKDSDLSTSDVTANNVVSTKHGFAPKSPADATQFLNGAATPAYAQVKDSDLSTSDITTNNVGSTKHGFAPKSPASATQFLNGAATPAYAQVKDSDLSLSDITTNNVSTTQHGFAPKLPNDATKFLDGTGNYSAPAAGWTLVPKTSDESRNTTTTPSNDAALTLSMAANTNYLSPGVIFFDGVAAAGFQYQFTGPSGGTKRVERHHAGGGNTPVFQAADSSYSTTNAGLSSTNTNPGVVEFEAFHLVGASGGTFAFQWAQNTSNAGNTTVRAGSYFEYKNF